MEAYKPPGSFEFVFNHLRVTVTNLQCPKLQRDLRSGLIEQCDQPSQPADGCFVASENHELIVFNLLELDVAAARQRLECVYDLLSFS